MTAAHPFSRACRITLRSSDLLATQKEQHPLLGGVSLVEGPGWVPGAYRQADPPRRYAAPLRGGDFRLPRFLTGREPGERSARSP